MKLLFQFSVTTFSNTYLLGPDKPGDSVLIDPGIMDVPLLKMIEGNGFYVRAILITHPAEHHLHAVRTILKLYDATIYCGSAKVYDFPCKIISDRQKINVAGFDIEAIDVSGYAGDSIAYRVDDALFSGEMLTAGRVGNTPNRYALSVLVSSIRQRVLSLSDKVMVFPAYGPPTTVGIERATNPFLKE